MNCDAVLIAGPTASGKSAAALSLAERFGGLVINADSMQVYRDLRVLSARPSPEDEARAPHRLYGHVPVTERYSVGRYQTEAAAALNEARRTKRLPIFVGGTGLYFSALEFGLSPMPQVPVEARETVRARFERMGREAFLADLAARDPEGAKPLRPSDTQRLLRAADVLEATGRSLSDWQNVKGEAVLGGLRLQRFVIAPPREIVVERAERRFQAMVENGALEEARVLRGLDLSLPAAKALGLRELWRHLDGEIGLDEAIAEAQGATRRYIKRQLTWFRNRMRDWKWLESADVSNLISNT